MSNECNGVCCREQKISIVIGKPIYRNGIKFCKRCNRFMRIESYRCPCCKGNVRCKSNRYKKHLQQSRLLISQTA
jgi:hypothetical protein